MSISDDKFAALRALDYTGSISDMTLQWLQDNGATSDVISDAWAEMLVDKGYNGIRADDWFELLGDEGYTGALSDREAAFWADGGTFS